MDKILKDIPLDGKILSIAEDTVTAGSLIFPSTHLRNVLIIKNEAIGIKQPICFERSGQLGDVLSSLITDFKNSREVRVKGKTSYFLINPLANIRIFFKKLGLPKGIKKIVMAVAHLVDTKDWQKISKEDKTALNMFMFAGAAIFSEQNDLTVSVDGKNKYIIRVHENGINGTIFLQQE